MTNRSILLLGAVAAAFAALLLPAYAQKATELYAPIGRSPGLSEDRTVIGTIESVDEEDGTITISGTAPASATVTERTRIYLDLSKRGEGNRYGELGDVKEGRRVEVLYEDRDSTDQGPAEWIKIEPTDPKN